MEVDDGFVSNERSYIYMWRRMMNGIQTAEVNIR